jgi:hypothetical protein
MGCDHAPCLNSACPCPRCCECDCGPHCSSSPGSSRDGRVKDRVAVAAVFAGGPSLWRYTVIEARRQRAWRGPRDTEHLSLSHTQVQAAGGCCGRFGRQMSFSMQNRFQETAAAILQGNDVCIHVPSSRGPLFPSHSRRSAMRSLVPTGRMGCTNTTPPSFLSRLSILRLLTVPLPARHCDR